MKNLTLVLGSLVALGLTTGACIDSVTAAPNAAPKARKVSLTHLSACSALLRDAFPDDTGGGWHINTCNKDGVIATNKAGQYAVLFSGEIYRVEADGSLTVLAGGK